MPSGDLSYRLFLTQCFSDNLIALLGAPPTRFGHLFLLAGFPAYLWPFYSHLSRVPNLVGRDSTHIHVTYGHDYDTTLFATDVQMQKGPPVAIVSILERNLRTRAKGVSTFVDALDLAEGGRINTLKRIDFRDAHILERLRRHLHYTENKTTPWRLLDQS